MRGGATDIRPLIGWADGRGPTGRAAADAYETNRRSAEPRPFPRFAELPFTNDWMAWRQRFAIARLPRVDWKRISVAQAERVLREMGFAPVGGTRWEHPDGSRLVLGEKMVEGAACAAFSELGFQRWDYQQLPLQVLDEHLRDYIWDDTDAWGAWLAGKKATTPFDKTSGAHGP